MQVSYLVEKYGQSTLAQTAMTNIEKSLGDTSSHDAFIVREAQSFFVTSNILVRRMFVNLIRNPNGMQIRLFQLFIWGFLMWAFMGSFGLLSSLKYRACLRIRNSRVLIPLRSLENCMIDKFKQL